MTSLFGSPITRIWSCSWYPMAGGAPFALRWRRWNSLIMGSSGAFRYQALVSMKGVPSHLRSSEVAQAILGSAGVKAEIAGDDALADPDDEQEMFVAAWCAHPNLIPDKMIIAMPESKDEHDGGSPLYLRPHEIIHDEVPALRYLIRIHPASRVSRLAYSAAFI